VVFDAVLGRSTANLDALLDHLLAQGDGEGVHGGCVGRHRGAETRDTVCLRCKTQEKAQFTHQHTEQRIGTFGGAVDGDRRQGNESQARRDVEAAGRGDQNETTTDCTRASGSHGSVVFALDVRDGQVTQVDGRFEVDGHFLHVEDVRDFDLHTVNDERQ